MRPNVSRALFDACCASALPLTNRSGRDGRRADPGRMAPPTCSHAVDTWHASRRRGSVVHASGHRCLTIGVRIACSRSREESRR